MRIAIDARELCGQPTGVGRYLMSVLKAWPALRSAISHDYVLCAHQPFSMPDLTPLRIETRISLGRGGTAWEQTRLPTLLRATKADVLFAPAYTSPWWCQTPVVLALHDVSFASHPEWFPLHQGLRRRILSGRSARQAARVLALTEFSRSEIHKWLGVPVNRIEVVNPGVTRWPDQGNRATVGGSEVLFVGSIFERRHVSELVEGVALLAQRHPEVTLRLVGHNRTSRRLDLPGLARRLGVENRFIHHEYVTDMELGSFYKNSRAFAFLSEYEGFGLTPLEAISAGVPPVVLDTPVAQEAYRDAALYIPSPDPLVVAEALEQIMFNEELRTRLLNAAANVVSRYSWTDCAAMVLRAIESTESH